MNLPLKFFLLDERRMISIRIGSTPSTFTKHENVNEGLTKAPALHKTAQAFEALLFLAIFL